jgi:hypothetical protein
MSGALWKRIGDLSTAPAGGGGGGGGGAGETTRCGQGNNKDLHNLLNIPGQKTHCPLKSLTKKSKAGKGAKRVMDQKQAAPAKDVQELLTTALTQFV